MNHIVPQALARSRRCLCPTCGVLQQLPDSESEFDCRSCGEELALENRLRTLEPDISDGEPGDESHNTLWNRHIEELPCPGCGSLFECQRADEVQSCAQCGSQSKLELRLLRIGIVDPEPPRERTREDDVNQRRERIDYAWDVTTEQLVWRILNEPDAVGRVHLARKFRDWGYCNATSAHFLPFLLRQMQRDADAVAYRIGDLVGKLLCQDGRPFNLPVIHGCETVIHDVGGKRCLLGELGLGDWICLKILLDAAQTAVERGDRDYACHALWSINTIFERRYEHHHLMAQIVLYQMFTISGAVLGWALHMFEEGFQVGYSHPTEELLETMDELLQERPELAPALRRACEAGPPETKESFRRRMAMIRDFVTPDARAAACERLWYPPTWDAVLVAEAIGILEEALDHPQTYEPAGLALSRLFDERPRLAAMADLVRRRGDSLPERLRASYCRKFPDQDLLDPEPVMYWQDWQVEPEKSETDSLVEGWREGISAALTQYEADRKAAAPMLDAGDDLDLPIFTRDGPATIPLEET